MDFRVLPPLTTRGLSVAGWCLPPLVTYERMFRNRVHVTRCTRRAVTLFRLEEPRPARHGATAATDTGWVGSCSRHHSRHHSCLASTVQSAAQLQHTSYTPDS